MVDVCENHDYIKEYNIHSLVMSKNKRSLL